MEDTVSNSAFEEMLHSVLISRDDRDNPGAGDDAGDDGSSGARLQIRRDIVHLNLQRLIANQK
jgi:hypothetical protein